MLINFFSVSFDDCVMRGSGYIKLRLDDCYIEIFSIKISVIMNFMCYYYLGEVGKVFDLYFYLSGGNMSNWVIGFVLKGWCKFLLIRFFVICDFWFFERNVLIVFII